MGVKVKTAKKHKLSITLSHEDFSMLEELRRDYYYAMRRSKSNEIAWLIKEEWERFQEEKRRLAREEELAKTPAGLVEALKSVHARLEEKMGGFVAPCNDAKIIQFPAGQYMGSA